MTLDSITLADIKRWLLYTVLGILGAIALTWLGDLVVAQARGASALSSVHVNNVLVTPLKNGKAEYDYIGEEDVPCTHSLFPQRGHNPCWYVERHKNNMQLN